MIMEKYFCDITGNEIVNYDEDRNMVQIGNDEYDLSDEVVMKIKQYIQSLQSNQGNAPSNMNTGMQ